MTKVQGDWLVATGSQMAMRLLATAGHQAYFVGGCVRNALMGVPVSDVDIATDARPDVVAALAAEAGVKCIPTGIEHGTVTLVIDQTPYEVTTYRKDIETDGRRAVVAFSDDVVEDARRRDFTMNALYADATGQVLDPLGGLPDLVARQVRFIDDANQRIREDYLRILRFFRFHAWYGDPSAGLDPDALAAIAANLDGLDGLSKERVGAEMLKLLAAPDPSPALAAMKHVGVLAKVLPGADDRFLAPLVNAEAGRAADPLRRLAVLGGHEVADRLRLSRAQERKLALLREQVGTGADIAEIGYRHGAETGVDVALLRAAMFETPLAADAEARAQTGAAQKFPVSAQDLMPALQGAELGRALARMEDAWVASGFALGREELLARRR